MAIVIVVLTVIVVVIVAGVVVVAVIVVTVVTELALAAPRIISISTNIYGCNISFSAQLQDNYDL